MRPLIENLDVNTLDWQPLGPAGLYSKQLSRDPDTGARTALQRLVPADGYSPPTVAHYHHTYEEIIGVAGLFSFDSKRWIRPLSYVFHPPLTVHGFKSAVSEESLFLSRVGRDLDFNFVEEPTKDDIYPVDGTPPPREARAYADPVTDPGFRTVQWGRGTMPVECCVLSADPLSGEGSAIVRVSPGWRAEIGGGVPGDYLEWFVMDGDLRVDGDHMGTHFYSFRPAGTFPDVMSSDGGALLYVNFGPPGLFPDPA
ncbi:MAG: hypothetical protein WEB93_01630 [Sphingomonadales bacterium]